MKKKPVRRDYHARLVIYGLPSMKAADYQRLINWLEVRIKEFKKEKKDTRIFAKRFVARLMK